VAILNGAVPSRSAKTRLAGFAIFLVSAAVVGGGGLLLAGASAAEEPKRAPGTAACYEVVGPGNDSLPKSPILVNKCTGQTYLLVRSGGPKGPQKYDWVPIAIREQPQPTVASRRCFTYDGREFCP
jgi:hypothetical protein